jgi:hypothetical protein
VEEEFRGSLEEKGLAASDVSAAVSAVTEFEAFLLSTGTGLGGATGRELDAYTVELIAEGANTYDRYVALARYGAFIANWDFYASVLELVDGAEVVPLLFRKLDEAIGSARRHEILRGLDIPPLGLPAGQKAELAGAIMKHLASALPSEMYTRMLCDIRHALPGDFRAEAREEFLEAGDIDTYIERSAAGFILQLEKHSETGSLFYNQAITPDVVAWVSNHPEIACVVRDGDTLYKTKIPYRAERYLAETDPLQRRYYACHCPWARDSILPGADAVSSEFCHCSAGYVVQVWEKALDTKLEVEVLETALAGDDRCRFAIRLPSGYQ